MAALLWSRAWEWCLVPCRRAPSHKLAVMVLALLVALTTSSRADSWRHPGGLWSLSWQADVVAVIEVRDLPDATPDRYGRIRLGFDVTVNGHVTAVLKGHVSDKRIRVLARNTFVPSRHAPGEYLAFLRSTEDGRYAVVGCNEGRFFKNDFTKEDWSFLVRAASEVIAQQTGEDAPSAADIESKRCRVLLQMIERPSPVRRLALLDVIGKGMRRGFTLRVGCDTSPLLDCLENEGATVDRIFRSASVFDDDFHMLFCVWSSVVDSQSEGVGVLYRKLLKEKASDNIQGRYDFRYPIAEWLINAAGFEGSVAPPQGRFEGAAFRNGEIQKFCKRFRDASGVS